MTGPRTALAWLRRRSSGARRVSSRLSAVLVGGR